MNPSYNQKRKLCTGFVLCKERCDSSERPEDDPRPTDNKPPQQGDAQGDSEGNGLTDALVRRINVSIGHIREDVLHTEKHTGRNTTMVGRDLKQCWVFYSHSL